MPATIMPEITVVGDKNAVRDLVWVGHRGADIRPIAPVIRAVYLQSNRRTWATTRGWPELSDATIAEKERLGLDPRAERRSGALYAALTSEKAKGQINRVSAQRFTFGSRLFYGPWQQGTKHQPRRELIDLTYTDRLAIVTLISRFVAHGEFGLALFGRR